jgi:anthranilate phosphoribosyltransferase
VHGEPGWDEATPVGPFRRWSEGSEERLDPRDVGLPRCRPEDLAGGDPAENAAILRRVFAGEDGPVRDAVVLNAALALELAGVAIGRDAVDRAGEALSSGAVARLVEVLGA